MTVSEQIIIDGICETVINRYFETLNAADYDATASLFATEGTLYPPFESPITGQAAIAAYLAAEAKGMKLYPSKGTVETQEKDHVQATIKGKVETPLFGVNVAWIFVLNEIKEIISVEIKLLASLEELVKLKR